MSALAGDLITKDTVGLAGILQVHTTRELCWGSRVGMVMLSTKARPLAGIPKLRIVFLFGFLVYQKVNPLDYRPFGLAFMEILPPSHA